MCRMDETGRAYAEELDRADPLAGFADRFVAGAGGALPRRQLARAGCRASTADRLAARGGRGVGRRAGPVLVDLDLAGPPGRRPDRDGAARRPARRGGRRGLDHGQPLQAGRRRAGRPAGAHAWCCPPRDEFPTDRYVLQGLCAARGLTLRDVPADIDSGVSAGRRGRGAGLLGGGGGALARGVPVGGVAGPAGDHRGRARGRRAGALGPVATRAARCRSSCRRPVRTWPWAVRTSTSTAGRGRRPTSTCARTCRSPLRQPIQGWFGAARPVRDGARVRAGGRDRPVPGRHAAGALAGRGRGGRAGARGGRDRPAAGQGSGDDVVPGRAGRRLAGAAGLPAGLAAGPGAARVARLAARTRRRGRSARRCSTAAWCRTTGRRTGCGSGRRR